MHRLCILLAAIFLTAHGCGFTNEPDPGFAGGMSTSEPDSDHNLTADAGAREAHDECEMDALPCDTPTNDTMDGGTVPHSPGALDGGVEDGGNSDGGVEDGGPSDASTRDAIAPDQGQPDSDVNDSGTGPSSDAGPACADLDMLCGDATPPPSADAN